jgi:hypothetical protein
MMHTTMLSPNAVTPPVVMSHAASLSMFWWCHWLP